MGCKVHSTPTHRRTNGVVQESSQDIADYETALDAAGYGRFSRSALSAASFAFFSTGVQNCVMSYVLPAAKCELQLTTYQAGLVNMAFMCGGVASAFFWGIAGDVFGRRNVLSASLILDAFITVAQSMATDYRILLAVRSLNGFLIGCPSTLVLTYLSDLVGERRRQLYLTFTGLSFVAAWLILPAVAWLVIPLKTATPTILPIHSWRLYLALGSIPSLVAGVWMLFLPESPRLLADTDRNEEAVKILGRIHRLNCGSKEEYRVKKLKVENIFVAKNEDGEENRMKNLLIGVLRDLKTLVSKSYAVKSSLILFVFFGNMAAGFGLNNWIPELLIRMQGRSCQLASAAQTQVIASAVNSSIYNHLKPAFDYQTIEVGRENTTLYEQYSGRRTGDKVCNADMDDDIFTSGLIVGACCVLGNAACAILCSRGGARGVRYAAAGCALACTLACACLAAFACSCSASNQIAVAAAAALNAASLNGNVLLIRLLLHALPAKLSALGVCWGAWWGRAGGVATNFAVGVLLDYSCSAPFISVAAFLGVSVGAIMMIKIGDKEDPVVKDDQIEETNVEKNVKLGRYISTHM